MQIGVMSGTFRRPTLEEELDAVVDHGLHCMQLDLSSAGLPSMPDQIDGDTCDKIRKEMAARKIAMAAVNGMYNMIHPDVAQREDGLRKLGVLAPACKNLGTSVIALCTGTRNPKMMWLPHPDNHTPEAWKDLVDAMGKALQIAEKYDVTLAFEPEVDNVVDSAKTARRFLDEMGSPNLKIIMDCANIFHTGELPRMSEILDEAFDLLGKDTVFTHGKDLDHDGSAGHLPAGKGLLDYERYLALIDGLGFDSPLILHGLGEAQVDDSVAFVKGKQPGN